MEQDLEGLLMTTEKRLFEDNSKFIKEDFNKRLIRLDHALRVITPEGETKLPHDQLVILLTARKKLKNLPTVDAVEVVRFNALKSLVNGEWVDCKLVEEALGIDFATGLKMFDFSRTAEWNPAPLNGQKITTKFRMKNAVEVVHGQWLYDSGRECYFCSACNKEALHTSHDDPVYDYDWEENLRYSYTDTIVEEHLTNYCPNCGAKMDGDGNG